MPRHADRQVKNVADLIKFLKKDIKKSEHIWYRGHDNESWKLEPSITRQGYPDPLGTGLQLYKRFVQNATKIIGSPPRDEYEWMAYMQHYGIPTHLMDWSENPLVALFFAVQDEKLHSENGALYMMDPSKFNEDAGHVTKGKKEVFAFGIDAGTDEYLFSKINATNPHAKIPPMALIGIKNSVRIQAQEGVFVAHHRDCLWMDSNFASQQWGWKYIVPSSAKSTILEELRILLMDLYTVYPQLENLAIRIKKGAH